MENTPGLDLAPNDSIFEITEGDPLLDSQPSSNQEEDFSFLVEEPKADTPTEDSLIIEEDDIPSLDEISGTDLMKQSAELAHDMNDDSLEEPITLEEDINNDPLGDNAFLGDTSVQIEEPETHVDYDNPGQLAASILDQARRLGKYDFSSPNSMRRALAACDHLERMIIAGVQADATTATLTIPQLKLLDDIELGIHDTRSALKHSSKTVQAGRNADKPLIYDPFCSTIARVLINAQVQGGKKVQDVFANLKKKYSINDREALQVSQIMLDLGYPVRSLLDDGVDMIAQFNA